MTIFPWGIKNHGINTTPYYYPLLNNVTKEKKVTGNFKDNRVLLPPKWNNKIIKRSELTGSPPPKVF